MNLLTNPASTRSLSPTVRSLMLSISAFVSFVLLANPSANRATAQSLPERPPTQELLPETTVAFIQIDDIRDMLTKFREGSFGKMLSDESVAPLVESLWGEAKSAYADVEAEVGVSLEDLQAFPAGEMTFAVIVPRRKDPEFMLILQTDPESEAVDRIMERGREAIREGGEELTTEESEDGIEYESFRVDDRTVKFFRHEGLLVASTSEDELDAFIMRWKGLEVENSRPLSQNRKFITIMNRCLGTKDIQPEARFFVDPIAAIKASTRGNAGAQFAIALLPTLGLDGLNGIGGSILLSEDEFASVVHAHVLLAEPRQGIFEMFAFRPTTYQPEPWLPSDVTTYWTTSWDINQMLAELTKIIETFQGEGAVDRFFTETMDEELGFNVREEMLGNLTGRMTMTQWMEPPIRLTSQITILALEVEDAVKMEETLEKIIARINRDLPEDSDRRWIATDYQGVQIFGPSDEGAERLRNERLERRRQRREERGNTNNADLELEVTVDQPSIALVGNYLILSTFPPQSREFLHHAIETDQGDFESLADSEDFKRVSEKMARMLKNDLPSAIFYADPRVSLRALFEMTKDQTAQSLLNEQAAQNKYVSGIKNAWDQNPLPDFSELEHYFQPQGGFMTSDESGLHFLLFELRAKD